MAGLSNFDYLQIATYAGQSGVRVSEEGILFKEAVLDFSLFDEDKFSKLASGDRWDEIVRLAGGLKKDNNGKVMPLPVEDLRRGLSLALQEAYDRDELINGIQSGKKQAEENVASTPVSAQLPAEVAADARAAAQGAASAGCSTASILVGNCNVFAARLVAREREAGLTP